MHRIVTLVISTVLLLLVGCTGRGDTMHEMQAGDSIVTEAVTVSLVAGDVERALAIVDSAESAGDISGFHAQLLRCKAFSDNESTIDTARIILERLLRQEHLSDNQQTAVLEQLFYVARLR